MAPAITGKKRPSSPHGPDTPTPLPIHPATAAAVAALAAQPSDSAQLPMPPVNSPATPSPSIKAVNAAASDTPAPVATRPATEAAVAALAAAQGGPTPPVSLAMPTSSDREWEAARLAYLRSVTDELPPQAVDELWSLLEYRLGPGSSADNTEWRKMALALTAKLHPDQLIAVGRGGNPCLLVKAIQKEETEIALAMIAKLDRNQLDQRPFGDMTFFAMAIKLKNERIAEALILKQAPEPNRTDAGLQNTRSVLEGHLLPDLVSVIGSYEPEMYLYEPHYTNVPPEAIDHTLRALLNVQFDPAPYQSDRCWLRSYPQDKIRTFFDSLTQWEKVNLFTRAVKINLPRFVEVASDTVLHLGATNELDRGMVEALEHDYSAIKPLILNMMNQLTPNLNLNAKASDLLRIAAEKGYLWAVKQLCVRVPNWTDAMWTAANEGHLPVVQWLVENCPSFCEEQFVHIMCGCINSWNVNTKPIFDWIVTYRGGRWTTPNNIKKVLSKVPSWNDFQNLQWLFEPPLSFKVDARDVREAFIGLAATQGDTEGPDQDPKAVVEGMNILLRALPENMEEETVLKAWDAMLENPIADQWFEEAENFDLDLDPDDEPGIGPVERWFLECKYVTDRVLQKKLVLCR